MKRRCALKAGGAGLLSFRAAGCLGQISGTTQSGQEPVEDGETTDVDVIVIAGQSNAVGKGSSTESPDVEPGSAYEYKPDMDELVDLDDPVGQDNSPPEQQADTGSAWPAFAKEYYTRTGRPAAYVPYAVGGSAQSDKAHSDPDMLWSDSGNLDDNAQAKLDETVTWLNNNGYNPNVRGVVWCQGERDAAEIDNGDMTKPDYKTEFGAHIDRWQSRFGSDFRFFICQTGHENDGDTQGYQDVRAAQSGLANDREYVEMVSTIQKNFPEDGKLQDRWHYTQTGYNEMGSEAGKNTSSIISNSAELTSSPR